MIFHFPLIPKKIEMILLLTAEYSLKTNTEEINMEETEYSCDNCGHQFKNEEEWSGNCDEHSCSNCECDCSDCAEEEPNSDDDDYEDKMAGKLNCRRCDEAKAWSYVFDGGECLNYCSPCLAELEDKKYIVKAEENQNGIQYRFIEQ
jgi:hypothetical protein